MGMIVGEAGEVCLCERQLRGYDCCGNAHDVGGLLIGVSFDGDEQECACNAFRHFGNHLVNRVGVERRGAVADRIADDR